MSRIHVTETIHAPIADIFKYSIDYKKRMQWDNFAKRMVFLDGSSEVEVGGISRTYTHYGFTMETEYVSREDPFVYAVKMTKGPFFIRSFAGSWRYEKINEDETKVSFIYNIQTWPAFIQPVFNFIYKKDMQKRIWALKHFMENK